MTADSAVKWVIAGALIGLGFHLASIASALEKIAKAMQP